MRTKIKPEANNEYTYQNPANNHEFMVWFDDDGTPTRIYTYADSEDPSDNHSLALGVWEAKDNKLFIHCPKELLQHALGVIQYCCICTELVD